MNEARVEKYLGGCGFRINSSIYKQAIFHAIINRLMESECVGCKQIKVSNWICASIKQYIGLFK